MNDSKRWGRKECKGRGECFLRSECNISQLVSLLLRIRKLRLVEVTLQ